ncbi:hypothetical protein [Gynuella sunshinyii]|uniref:Uncharacterized protein n=1 Tax=Gynuella sunshinyii YC6258 TaxID=1445510 RepID=A0A0C5VQ40_9GAMM|nr:hypothetical protein [Gynuella sunshinyii]AJQ96366.1 hypothetical Protein YC6258_04334 [Gynuella sunshinyii YC6258]
MNTETLPKKILRDWQSIRRMTDEIDLLFAADNIPDLLKISQKRQQKIEMFFSHINAHASAYTTQIRDHIADDIDYIRQQHTKIRQLLEQKQQMLLKEQNQLKVRANALKAYGGEE